MPKVAAKRIREKATQMKNAWNEGAPAVTEFRNTTKDGFEADLAAAQVVDNEIDELKAQTRMKEDLRDNLYAKIGGSMVDVRKGVEGHKDYGDDSPLYGAMGFVRKSERKSGLTRKIKTSEPKPGDTE